MPTNPRNTPEGTPLTWRKKTQPDDSLGNSPVESPDSVDRESQDDGNKSKLQGCLHGCRNFFRLTKEGATPPNWTIITLMFITIFASAYSITFLFPFLPSMILYFGYEEEEKGHYAGIIASSMFAGRVFGSYFWGWLADKKGRKPVILLTLTFVGGTGIAFGLSKSVLWAVVTRFLCGLFNGLVGTVKTILYEVSDNTNQAMAMGAIALGWGSGIVLGPLISGYLSEPATKYPSHFSKDGFFGLFPFFLSSVMTTLVCVLAAVLCWWKLPETLERKRIIIEREVKSKERATECLVFQNKPQDGTDTGNIVSGLSVPDGNATTPESDSLLRNGERILPPGVPASINLDELGYVDDSEDDLDKDDDEADIDTVDMGIRTTSMGDLLLPDVKAVQARARSKLSLNKSRETLNRSRQTLNKSRDTLNKSRDNLRKSKDTLSRSRDLLGSRNSLRKSRDTLGEVPVVVVAGKTTETIVPRQRNGQFPGSGISPSPSDKDVALQSKQNCCSWRCCLCFEKIKELSVIKLLSQSDVRYATLLYSLFSFSVIGWHEVFTVFASTDRYLDGLAFSTEQIGNAIGLSSVPMLLLQVFIFPKLEQWLGALRTFQVGCTFLIISSTLTACLRALQSQVVVLWAVLLVVRGIQEICIVSCFSASGLFINNSVTPDLAGKVNGLSMTFTAFTRCLAPVVGGSLFAWSITGGRKIGFPFDVNLTFMLFGLVYMLSNFLSAFIPKHVERQSKKGSVKSNK